MTKRTCIARITLLQWFMPIVLLYVLLDVSIGQDVTARRVYEAIPGKYVGTTSGSNKVSSILRAVMDEMEARGMTRQNARELSAPALSNPLVRVNEEGRIQAYIYVNTVGDAEKILLETYEVSIEITNEELGIIQAQVPFDSIEEVAQLAFVRRITPASYGTPRVGSVTTDGDAILRAHELRALGFDGSGVKVGVISDGVDNRAEAQQSGDLPANITIVTLAGSGDEGTAVLEIIHDLAPGAELGFCGPETTLEMIDCVTDLAEVFGADIIVDDLGFFGEPYFEDGPVAQAVADVVENVAYVSAAGNDAESHYQAEYVDSGNAWNDHDFGGGDTTLPIAGPFGVVVVILQWSNAFGSAGDDYDICLTNAASTLTFGCSDDIQNGDDDPIEMLITDCDNSNGCTGNILISKYSGNAQELEMFFLGANPTQFNVSADSIFGHPAVLGVLATAAVDASDPGNDDIEAFSSQGPSTIFFPAPETRQKPDVTAIDGVSVTGAGGFPSPFSGTSASAPHVAGVAALLKEGFTTAAEIVDALKNSAVDLGDPGADNTFGAGRVDAFAAAQQLDQTDGIIDTPTGDITINQGESVNFTGTGTDLNGHFPLSFLWDFGGGATNSDQEDPGDVTFNTAGTFTVTFTVTDSLGFSDQEPATLTIRVNAPPDGVIDTPTGDVTINEGESVNFTSTGTDPDGDLPLIFLWDFGGGATNSTQEDPGDVTFNTAGTFTVTLTATDSLALVDPTPDTLTIAVSASPVEEAAAEPACFIGTAGKSLGW